MKQSRIEPVTFRHVAQCLNQLRHRIRCPTQCAWIKFKWTKTQTKIVPPCVIQPFTEIDTNPRTEYNYSNKLHVWVWWLLPNCTTHKTRWFHHVLELQVKTYMKSASDLHFPLCISKLSVNKDNWMIQWMWDQRQCLFKHNATIVNKTVSKICFEVL